MMLIPIVITALSFVAPTPRPEVSRASTELRKEWDAIRAREETALKALADTLTGEDSARVKALIDPPIAPDGSSRFVPLGEIIRKADLLLPVELKTIRVDAAKAYFELAGRCLPPAIPHLALADACLRAVVARDPEHAAAWRLLGYVPHDGGWATPFAVEKLEKRLVLHPVYGWVDQSWVTHLDRGELPALFAGTGKETRWLPAADADRFRREFAKGWQISTEHFAIQTNVPLNEAIGFGRRLEALHELFGSLMADVIGPEFLPLAQLAKKPKSLPTPAKKPHRVLYFADREEYIRFLLPVQGEGIRVNLGTYLPKKETKPLGFPDGVSFFFRDPGGQLDVTENLDHEVSHQLLFEMAGSDKSNPNSNFWVFEGLGTYFETMRLQPDGSLRIGGMIGKRIAAAQLRLIKQGEFIPISRLTSYNRFLFYGGDGGDIYLNYAEAMALTVYFMQAHNTRYREAFLEYAHDVHRGRLKVGAGKSLEDRLGTNYGDLARDFLATLKQAKPLDASGQAGP